MQTFYIGNSFLVDELAIAQQLICDIHTCFGADVGYWIGRLWLQRRPIAEPLAAPMGVAKGAHRGEVWRLIETNLPPLSSTLAPPLGAISRLVLCYSSL